MWNSPEPAPAEEPCTFVTISGGAGSFDLESEERAGISTGLSGSHIRFSISLACVAIAVFSPRRRLMGLRERRSADMGIASGIGSDIMARYSVQSVQSSNRDQFVACLNKCVAVICIGSHVRLKILVGPRDSDL